MMFSHKLLILNFYPEIEYALYGLYDAQIRVALIAGNKLCWRGKTTVQEEKQVGNKFITVILCSMDCSMCYTGCHKCGLRNSC